MCFEIEMCLNGKMFLLLIESVCPSKMINAPTECISLPLELCYILLIGLSEMINIVLPSYTICLKCWMITPSNYFSNY